MKTTSTFKWVGLACSILLAGCAPQKPTNTNDPDASIKWMNYALEKSTEQHTAAHQLREIYAHAEALEAAFPDDERVAAFQTQCGEKIQRIPQRVYRQSIPEDDFKSFKWALAKDPSIKAQFSEYIELWKRGSQWCELALDTFPGALSVFMSQAIDDRNTVLFDSYVEAFKASGYALTPPLQKSEFMARHLAFIGLEGEKAIAKNDSERIRFLLAHTPSFKELNQCGAATRRRIQKLGTHALNELGDEELITHLLAAGFVFGSIDLDKVDTKSSFVRSLVANPQKAVQMAGLDRPGKPLDKNAARFLLTLPVEELTNLHPQHIDEAIGLCLEAGGSSIAQQFIQLKASQKPLEKADYIKLMTLGLKHADTTIYNLAKRQGGNINIFELDLAELADNQEVFQRYAPKFMENIYPTMEDESKEDGITMGRIYRIFESKNQEAGLYIVKTNKGLANDWPSVNQGRTLLMDACRSGNLEVVKHLIEKRRADPQETTRFSSREVTMFGSARASEGKLSAIHFAAQSGNAELIKYLQAEGANINAQSHYGATPLMIAASAGHVDAVATLLDLGASANTTMNPTYRGDIYEDGKNYAQLSTALKRARAYQHNEIVALLEKAGAR